MSNALQFRGVRSPITIISADSFGISGNIPSLSDNITLHNALGLKRTLSGATTANNYKNLLSVNGAGVLQFAGCYTNNTTLKTFGLKVVIDGITIYDTTTGVSTNAIARGLVAAGVCYYDGNNAILHGHYSQMYFNSSLSIDIKSSASSETDGMAILYNYYLI